MKIYKITEASDYLGVSINTLKTLANNGKIKSFKTTGEHRRFRQEDLDAYMGVEKEKQEKLTVIYARCSTAKQKENLERQKDRLRKHAEAKGYKYVLIDEIASGINEKRNGIHKLIKMCFEGKVERVLIEYKDRLARFGYEYLDAIFTNLVKPPIRFVFSANTSALSGDSYFVHNIYRLDYETFKLYGDNQIDSSVNVKNISNSEDTRGNTNKINRELANDFNKINGNKILK